MAVLSRPVMIRIDSMPLATASSTAYWISGLSTSGSISLGLDFVAGRNRVPRPAAGKTALRILFAIALLLNSRYGQKRECNRACGSAVAQARSLTVAFLSVSKMLG